MTKLRVAINGLGRIGRAILREWYQQESKLDIVAVNNPGDPATYLHLLKFDSLHGPWRAPLEYRDQCLRIGDKTLAFHQLKEPREIPWEQQEVDVVIDATGKFKDGKALGQHLKGSVKKVVMCAPGKDLDATFVFGINHQQYDPDRHHIVSNASCTTNCLAPLASVLHQTFGIENGLMTTIHSYTSDQRLLDSSHSDLRRARAAALNMVPTTTGAAKAVGLVIPELRGKLDGFAIRVPTPNVSVVDLTANLSRSADAQEINQAIQAAAQGPLKGILAYAEDELVSQDFIGRRESSIFDPFLTNSLGKTIKVVSWYDNEIGFSNRVLDLVTYMGERGRP